MRVAGLKIVKNDKGITCILQNKTDYPIIYVHWMPQHQEFYASTLDSFGSLYDKDRFVIPPLVYAESCESSTRSFQCELNADAAANIARWFGQEAELCG